MSEDLEARVKVLEDMEAIKKLKYRMLYYLDHRDFAAANDCFSSNPKMDCGEYGKPVGRDEVTKFHMEILPKMSKFTMHFIFNPDIEITGETTAKGRYYGYIPRTTANNEANFLCVMYDEEYVKENGVWKISSYAIDFVYTITRYDGFPYEGWPR